MSTLVFWTNSIPGTIPVLKLNPKRFFKQWYELNEGMDHYPMRLNIHDRKKYMM